MQLRCKVEYIPGIRLVVVKSIVLSNGSAEPVTRADSGWMRRQPKVEVKKGAVLAGEHRGVSMASSSMRRRFPPGATHNSELISECLATLLELAPQLVAEERAYVEAQHPFATAAWVEALLAASSGEIPQDIQLIAALEDHISQTEHQDLIMHAALQAAEERAASAEERMAVLESNSAVFLDPAPIPPQHAKAGSRTPVSKSGSRNTSSPKRALSPPPSRGGGASMDASPRDPESAASSARTGKKKASAVRRPPKQPPSAEPSFKDNEANWPSSRADPPRPEQRTRSDPEQHADESFWDDDTGHGTHAANDAEEEEEEERRRAARAEKRFDSISQEIKALNSGEIDQPSTVEESDSREPCPRCGRKFKLDRLQKHISVCKAAREGQESRGVFNAASPMMPAATPSKVGGKSPARHVSPSKGRSKTGGKFGGVVAASHSR